jgi:glutamine amidotransferase
MCELMGLSFARPVSADFSIREFAGRDLQNADGWGLAWYPDRSLALVKEPISWRASPYSVFLQSYQRLMASIYLAHVRHKTVGGAATHADTHPFARELHGRDYCFAHNGTLVAPAGELRLGLFRPVGSTDSEHAFCHLLDEVARREVDLSAEPGWRWLHEKLAWLNRLGKLNCLLSDGLRLFCYFDQEGHKGLSWRRIEIRNHQTRRFEDSEMQIDLEGKSLNHGYVVATHPLSTSGWHSFQRGELVVLEAGEMRFSSHRSAKGQSRGASSAR